MRIDVSARHGHLSQEHQDEIRAKAEKLTHFFNRITMIEVMVDLGEPLKKKVEVKVDAEHKHDFVALGDHEELMVAVDLAIDRAQHQIHKYKEKVQDHRG
ncbi:MAG: HPF/RaiA family ribosome-associated protein [Zavarzinella sp.]